MSNYKTYAMREFRAAGWIDENGKFKDDMQQAICEHILMLLDVFADEGHSGASAPYAVELFEKLALFKPLVPLTGEDWEWNEILSFGDDMKYQNKRCPHVFKGSDGRAYDGQGIVFWEWRKDGVDEEPYKSYFTGKGSRVYIEFPYMPTIEYKEMVRDE